MPSGSGGMGRTSDTRMYNPRSESTRLFGYEDDETGYAHGYGDPEVSAAKNEKEKRKKEETKNRQRIHHVKIKNKDVVGAMPLDEEPLPGQEVTQEGDGEAPPKDEMQAELSQLTGASGSRGAELDQAVGAKTGTGSAMGGIPPLLGPQGVYRSQFVEAAWSELLKYDNPDQPIITWLTPEKSMAWVNGHGPYTSESIYAALKEQGTWDNRVEEISDTYYSQHGLENPKGEYEMPPTDPNLHEQQAFQEEMFDEEGNLKLSEPMALAWSSLLKSKKGKGEGAMAGGEIGSAGTTTQRRKEHAKKWAQPKFHGPPGGRRPWTGTSRRAKARSRTLSPRHRVHNVKGGLMHAPLAVHMSHLGVQTKQPMRQFPEKYRQYYGQQLRRRLTGNIPQTVSPHALFGERTQYPGPTGGGRLPGLLPGQAAAARMPSLRRLAKPRMPRLRPPSGFNPMTPPTVPSAPSLPQPAQVGLPSSSMVTASEDVVRGSDIQKNIMGPGSYGFVHAQDIKRLLRELRHALDKHGRMRKAKDTSGAGEDKPDYPANSPKKTTRAEGPTETPPDQDARTWGLEPSAIVGNH